MNEEIEKLRNKAWAKGCGFSIICCEADRTWYATIDSPAPAENFIGKNRSDVHDAIADAHAFLDQLP